MADCVKIDSKPVMDCNGFTIPLDDGREEIFKQWQIRDLELRSKKLADEMEAVKALEEQRLVEEQAVVRPALRVHPQDACKRVNASKNIPLYLLTTN